MQWYPEASFQSEFYQFVSLDFAAHELDGRSSGPTYRFMLGDFIQYSAVTESIHDNQLNSVI